MVFQRHLLLLPKYILPRNPETIIVSRLTLSWIRTVSGLSVLLRILKLFFVALVWTLQCWCIDWGFTGWSITGWALNEGFKCVPLQLNVCRHSCKAGDSSECDDYCPCLFHSSKCHFPFLISFGKHKKNSMIVFMFTAQFHSFKQIKSEKKRRLFPKSALCDLYPLLNALRRCHIDHAPVFMKGQYAVRVDEHGV